jgi:hypothetical protein
MAKRPKAKKSSRVPRSAQEAEAITDRLKREPGSIVARLTARVRRSPEALAAQAAEAERQRQAAESARRREAERLRRVAEDELLRQSMARTREIMNQGNDPHRK